MGDFVYDDSDDDSNILGNYSKELKQMTEQIIKAGENNSDDVLKVSNSKL